MSVVGEAYVRIRPQTSGFRQAAEGEMHSQVAGLAKTAAATFAGVFAAQKLFDFGKSAVQDAADIQKAGETVASSFGKGADQIDRFAKGAFKLGLSKDTVLSTATSFGLLFHNLGIGGDQAAHMTINVQKLAGALSIMKNTDPASALKALNTALVTGSTRGLKDYGVALGTAQVKQEALNLGLVKGTVDEQKVSAARARVAADTQKVAEATKKYGSSSSQALGAVASLKSAQDSLSKAIQGGTIGALTPAIRSQAIYQLLIKQLPNYLDQASKHSGDLASREIKLNAQWQNAKATIGEILLPAVAQLTSAFAANLPAALNATVSTFRSGFDSMQSVLPPILSGVKLLTGFLYENKTIVFDLVGAYIAFKVASGALNEVLAIGRDVQGAYNTIMAAGAGAAVTETDTTVALTAALEANTAALQGQSIAAGEATAAQTGLAAAEVEAGTAAEAASAGGLAQFGSGLVALAGGPVVIATAAIAGLVGGMIYFASTEESVVEAATNRLNLAFQHLGTNFRNAANDRKIIATALKSEPEDKLAVAQARLNVQQAKANLNNKSLNQTTLQHKQNLLQLRAAEIQLSNAQGKLTGDEQAATNTARRLNATLEHRSVIIRNLEKSIEAQSKAEFTNALSQATATARIQEGIGPRGANLSVSEKQRLATEAQQKALGPWIKSVQESAAGQKNLTPLMRHNVDLLTEYAQRIRRVPTKQETHFILNIRSARESLNQLITQMSGIGVRTTRVGHNVGTGFVDGIVKGTQDRAAAARQAAFDTVDETYRGALTKGQIRSPSQLFRTGVGQPIVNGVIAGIQDRQPNLLDQMVTTLQALMAPSKRNAILIGRGITGGIVMGIGGLAQTLGSVIIGGVQGALDAARSHFGIKSPSSVWSAQLGQPLRDGIIHGMGGLEQMLVTRVTKAAQAAQAAAGGFGGGATPTGSAATGANQRLGMQMMLAHGWPASQWGALQALWNRESGWNQYAKNPSSGAYGIPQSLPASKMASAGSDWMTNPATQIRWGLGYISGRYGSPGAAWAHELSAGWYKHGGYSRGFGIAGEDGPEFVVPGSRVSSSADTLGTFGKLASAIEQLTRRLDQMQRPSIREFHMHTPALTGEGAAYDALNALTRKVAPV